MCHQSVGLLARYLEEHGIPTATVTSSRDITQKVNPPRAAFLNYPLGHSTGKPFDLDDQVGIVRAALGMLETASASPVLLDLPNSWEDIEPGWEDKVYQQVTPEADH